MIAMIFEFWMNPADTEMFDGYTATSARMREALAAIDGFRAVERFESCTESGKFVAIGSFDDEASVTAWRLQPDHRVAQRLGRDRYFIDYRLRMAEVLRDYGPDDRVQAPADSNTHHGRN